MYWLGAGKLHARVARELFDQAATKTWPKGRGFYGFVHAYARAVNGGRKKKVKVPKPLWVTESGGMYGSGGKVVTNTFASAFWYLDELGELAKEGVAVHCRQALVGGHYGLLARRGANFAPRPDYFATKLWATLMGPVALYADWRQTESDAGNEATAGARAYAHCGLAADGSLALLFINAQTRRARRVTLPQNLAKLPRAEYHVTAPVASDGSSDLYADVALLNGTPLVEPDQPLEPKHKPTGGAVLVAPASYVFLAIPSARWPPCLPP